MSRQESFPDGRQTIFMRSRDRYIFESSSDVHFVSSTVVGFVPIFEIPAIATIFIEKLRFYLMRGDFTLLAWVLMPEHFHLLLRMASQHGVSSAIGNLKRITAREIIAFLDSQRRVELLVRLSAEAAREPTQDSRVWQYRFDSLVITSESTLKEKLEYIHNNPVRRKLVSQSAQWSNSSAADYDGRRDGPLPVDVYWECLGYGKLPSGKDS